jgi:RecJ-like exonuclease
MNNEQHPFDEFMEDLDWGCPTCEGQGKVQYFKCKNDSSECCGGCYEIEDCPDCEEK